MKNNIISKKKTKMNFIINNVLPSVILIIGVIGNLFGIIVLARKKLKQIGPNLVYQCLFIADSAYLGNVVLLLASFHVN